MKLAFLTADGLAMPVAYHLQQTGHEVLVGQVKDWRQIKMKRKEAPEQTKRRMSLYDGLLKNKMDAEKLTRQLLTADPEEWFVFCDFNYLYPFADQLRTAGFRGLLPTKADQRLEKDRRFAKQFVEKNFPDVAVAEYQEFKRIEDARKYMDKNADTLYVLKGYNDECPTIVPSTKNPKTARLLVTDALERMREWYEKEGFVLEEKIPDIIEFTPEAIAYDGQVIAVSVDIEHKLLGSRGGPLEGCSLSLVFWQELDGAIYQQFLAPLADMMVRPNELTFWDMSVYWSPSRKQFFFGEFCGNRPGYDSLFAELAITGGAEAFFETIQAGRMFDDAHEFGTTLRVFNLQKEEKMRAWKELIVGNIADPNVWAWDVKREQGKVYTAGYDKNTYIVTGSADSIDDAIQNMYDTDKRVVFDSGFSLEKHDWYDLEFPENVLHRYKVLSELEGEQMGGENNAIQEKDTD